jgi:hypothetical protein
MALGPLWNDSEKLFSSGQGENAKQVLNFETKIPAEFQQFTATLLEPVRLSMVP